MLAYKRALVITVINPQNRVEVPIKVWLDEEADMLDYCVMPSLVIRHLAVDFFQTSTDA